MAEQMPFARRVVNSRRLSMLRAWDAAAVTVASLRATEKEWRCPIAAKLTRPDDSYAQLLATHDGQTAAESHAMNARLILILMNHIGCHQVLAKALRLARDYAGRQLP